VSWCRFEYNFVCSLLQYFKAFQCSSRPWTVGRSFTFLCWLFKGLETQFQGLKFPLLQISYWIGSITGGNNQYFLPFGTRGKILKLFYSFYCIRIFGSCDFVFFESRNWTIFPPPFTIMLDISLFEFFSYIFGSYNC